MAWSSQRVLVSGGAGFIGSHLVDRLVEEGAEVRVLDNLHSGTRDNLRKSIPHLELVEGDIRDPRAVDRALSDREVLFHVAANASVPDSVEDPTYDFETNVCGTFNLLRSALRRGCRRIIYTSSAAVYGPPLYTPVDEQHPLEPISPYGGSKLAAERLLVAYSRTFGMEVAVARVFNTFGPRQPRYVMYDLLMKLRRDPARLEVLGDGAQRRDYCYIDDTVQALLLLGGAPTGQPLVVNISGGRTISIKELVAMILKALGLRGTRVTYGSPSWKGDIQVLSGDISRLLSLGVAPRHSLEEGLGLLIAWFQSVHGKIG